ncbi:hypothetical protein C8J57DRAFT_1249100 [Mycena rebaudengoi]|nr:hypothetical protein C8J57DRAFT_1249100 [Mycena rebaudengoi]
MYKLNCRRVGKVKIGCEIRDSWEDCGRRESSETAEVVARRARSHYQSTIRGFNIGMRTRQSISPAGARGIIFFTEIREISVGAQERMSGNIYGRQGKQIDQRVNCTLGTSVTRAERKLGRTMGMELNARSRKFENVNDEIARKPQRTAIACVRGLAGFWSTGAQFVVNKPELAILGFGFAARRSGRRGPQRSRQMLWTRYSRPGKTRRKESSPISTEWVSYCDNLRNSKMDEGINARKEGYAFSRSLHRSTFLPSQDSAWAGQDGYLLGCSMIIESNSKSRPPNPGDAVGDMYCGTPGGHIVLSGSATPCKLGQVPKTFSSANISFGPRKLLLLFSQLTLRKWKEHFSVTFQVERRAELAWKWKWKRNSNCLSYRICSSQSLLEKLVSQ